MTILVGAAMILSGAACFCGAVATRRWLGIVASGVMLLAMLDLSLWRAVPAIVWATLLLVAGGALGGALRPRALAPQQVWRIGRVAALVAALAYLCMAWLVVMHGVAVPGGAGASDDPAFGHGGHAMGGSALDLIPIGLSAMLALILGVIAVVAVGRRRRILALEAGGMGVMLSAMLAMTLAG